MRIYVASSWRNQVQPVLVDLLIAHGHEVYDFRNHTDPRAPEPHVFAWTEISEDWQAWTPRQYLSAIAHNVDGFECDMEGLEWCDLAVLCLPCGRSAHLEAGWAKGQGKRLFILLSEADFVPELRRMYLMADGIFPDARRLVKALADVEAGA